MIQSFRKKPIVIQGVQWDGSDEAFASIQSLNGLKRDLKTYGPNFDGVHYERLLISTLEGDMTAELGDWVLQGVSGEIYPCKPDIFVKTYEPV